MNCDVWFRVLLVATEQPGTWQKRWIVMSGIVNEHGLLLTVYCGGWTGMSPPDLEFRIRFITRLLFQIILNDKFNLEFVIFFFITFALILIIFIFLNFIRMKRNWNLGKKRHEKQDMKKQGNNTKIRKRMLLSQPDGHQATVTRLMSLRIDRVFDLAVQTLENNFWSYRLKAVGRIISLLPYVNCSLKFIFFFWL